MKISKFPNYPQFANIDKQGHVTVFVVDIGPFFCGDYSYFLKLIAGCSPPI